MAKPKKHDPDKTVRNPFLKDLIKLGHKVVIDKKVKARRRKKKVEEEEL